jgi:hypothetical protein
MIYTWYCRFREFLHSLHRQILNSLPYELLYRASVLLKKYWGIIFKPVLVITFSGSLIYFLISFYLKWPFNPLIILILFLVLFSIFVVLGAIRGENQKEVYFKDD